MVASYGTSSNQPDSPMPALFHIMSSPPPGLPAQKSARAPSRADLSVTSTARVHSRSEPNSSFNVARPSSLRSTAPTRQPLAWNSFAPSRPMPLPAPVMKTDVTVRQPASTASLMRFSVLVMSRTLRRLRKKPPSTQYTASHGAGVRRNDSVTSVPPPPLGANR